ncbi:MAG: hypothetical protein ABW190_08630 [Rhizobacter sp.]
MALLDNKLVFDVVDASATTVMTQVKTQELKGRLIPFYPASNPIGALTDVVINAAGQQRSIGVLRLWGHGTLEPHPGGNAILSATRGGGGFDLDEMLTDSAQAALPRLKPYFATGARVEFKHCRVATPAGWDWLVYLANQWDVEIHASARLQHLCSWSGDVYSVKPGRTPVLTRGIDP